MPPGGHALGFTPLRRSFSHKTCDGRGSSRQIFHWGYIEVYGLSGLDQLLKKGASVFCRALMNPIQQQQLFGRRALSEQLPGAPRHIRCMAQCGS
jgi:hypothetical protein